MSTVWIAPWLDDVRGRSVAGGIALAAAAAVLMLAPPAAAAGTTITVNNPGDASGASCPTDCTLRAAVAEADGLSGAVTVDLPSGTYLLTSGALQVGTAPGADIAIEGTGTAAQTIIRQKTAGDRVFNIDPSTKGNVIVTLKNLTITGGTGGAYGGGGILAGGISTDSLTVQDSVITGNTTTSGDNGGGISFGEGGNLTVTDSTISSNTATAADGAGLIYQGDAGNRLQISGSTITHNTATTGSAAGDGGGVYIAGGGSVHIAGSTLTDNTAADEGGAVYAAVGGVTLSLDRIVGNSDTEVYAISGGGISATDDWWGCNDRSCQSTGGATVSVPNWLVLRLLGVPTSPVSPGSRTTLTADLTDNSAGASVGALPNGTPVTFAASSGGVNPAGTTTSAGQASTTYTAPATGVSDSVSVTVDQQTVNGTVALAQPPTVTAEPASLAVCAGKPASFTAAADGSPTPTAQWQSEAAGGSTWTAISGATADTYALSTTTAADDGTQYRAVFTNANGSAPTDAATLTVQEPPLVTGNPASATAPALSTVTFSATATAGRPQWQVSLGAGLPFAPISGATSNTLTVTAQGQDNGHQYRAVFENGCGSATTSAATLDVTTVKPTVTWTVPATIAYGMPLDGSILDATATYGGKPVSGTFTYMPASGALLQPGPHTLSVQFQPADPLDYIPVTKTVSVEVESTVSAVSFSPSNLGGGRTSDWQVGFTLSSVGGLTVGQAVYLSGPAGTVFPSGTSAYTIAGEAPTAVAGGGTNAVRLTLAGGIGANIALQVVADGVHNPPAGPDPAADFTVATTADVEPASPAAGLTFVVPPAVTTQPTSSAVCAGQPATFSAAASGSPGVQWQAEPAGAATWSAISGATADTYTLAAATAADSGKRYRAVFTNPGGTATTDAATLTVQEPPRVRTDPAAVSTDAFSAVTFTAAATAGNVQWEVSADSGRTFSPVAGATSGTLTLTPTVAQSGDAYEAVFTNACGTVTTSAAALTVTPATPTIAWAVPATVAFGTPLGAALLDAQVTVGGTPVGGTLTYTPAAGAVLPLGTQTLRVSFQPADAADYTTAAEAVSVDVVSETAVSSVTFTPSSLSAGAIADWTVGFTPSGTGALTVGQAVYVSAPAGTVFPPRTGAYTIGGAAPTAVSGGGTNAVTLTLPAALAAKTPVQVVATGVGNPPAGSYPPAAFTVATATDAVTASPTTGQTFATGLLTVTPSAAPVGTTLALTGTGFGSTPGTVRFTQGGNRYTASALAGTWTDTGLRVALPAALSAGSASVAVRTSSAVLSNSVSVAVLGPPATVRLSVRTPVRAGALASVSGTVTDAAGHPLGGVTVQLTASPGTIAPAAPVTDATGAFTARVQTPDAPGSVTVTATAGAANATGTIQVQSSPGTGGGTPIPTPPPGRGPCTLSGGGALTLAMSAEAPSDLPAHMAVAGPVCIATGTEPAQPPVATLQYNASALQGLSAERLSLYRQGADGTWTFVPTVVDTAFLTVRAYLPGPGTYTVLANLQRFPDVPLGYWAEAPLDTLLGAGVVDGFPDGTFRPDAALTRAQFVKMLDLTLGLTVSGSTTPFTDVAPSAWYARYVAAAAKAGIVDGVGPTTFAPDAAVTREQMAVMLARALHLSQTTSLRFSDAAQIDPWAGPAVQEAVAAGYLDGFPDGTFRPLDPTTRTQAATVLTLAIAHEAPPAG